MTDLRGAGAILVISCYELGHPPFSTAMAMGFYEHAGFAPAHLDLAVETLDHDRVRRARLVVISVPMHTALHLGVRAARRIREVHPSCFICFAGLYALLNADHLLEGIADAVVGGEAEGALVTLAESLDRGGTPEHHADPVLERLPFVAPSRQDLPPLARYAQLEEGGARRLVGYVEASRGCLHSCRHCPIPSVYQGRFFVVPPDLILEDIRRQVSLGATHLTFGDPDFLNGPGHALKVVRAVHREFPALTFDFTAKVEHLLKHQRLLPELASLGCLFIVTAVESLSDRVLSHLDKGHTRADVTAALEVVRGAGITLRPTFVAFTPWTTLDDYVAVLDFVEQEGLVDHVDPIQYGVRLLVPPGSLLLEQASLRASLGSLDKESFSHRWTHPDQRMERLYHDVNTLVARAAEHGEDPGVTFLRIRDLALAARNGTQTARTWSPPDPHRPRPPRLTEPWFC
jgi:radical SAM superfamily enzyme YgiQ (UPF0313 family)